MNHNGDFFNEKDVLFNLKYNAGYFSDDMYGIGSSDKPFNNKITINLVPFVISLSDCKSDKECLDQNQRLAEICKKVYGSKIPEDEAMCKNSYLK